MRTGHIYYKGYRIEITGCWYKIQGYPDNVFEWMQDVREFIDKLDL
jgi:hypothetical protein